MTPEQFWDEDPDYFWAYWDAYVEKKKEQAIEDDIKAYNQGQYFMLAMAQVLQFSKHQKKIYPKEPLAIKSKNRAKMSQEEYEEIRKIQLQQMVDKFNKKK